MRILLLLAIGVAGIVGFHSGQHFPIWFSVFCMALVTVFLVQNFAQKRTGLLLMLYWLAFVMPFIHIPPYLWYDFDREAPLLLWGMVIRSYMLEERIIKLTAMLGAIGGVGFCLGVLLHSRKIFRDAGLAVGKNQRAIKTLSLPVWLGWVAVGFLLSWLIAPTDSLFAAQYTASESLMDTKSFGSAVTVSYGLLTYALTDALFEQNPKTKDFKRKLVIWTIIFIMLYFQLLRGSRTAIPFVLGCLLTYFYWGAPLMPRRIKAVPWVKIGMGGFSLFLLSWVIGMTRDYLHYVKDFSGLISLFSSLRDAGKLDLSNLLRGTWSAILLTPLSVAGDHIYGLLRLKMGQDYVDLFLSLPPGFVADALGYTRPLNDLTGPAWEMRFGMGGTHFTVVPFMNFRMTGVLLIPGLLAFVITSFEKKALGRLSVINLSLLCMLAAVGPHFLWYGEKYGINTLIVWSFLGVCYRISLSLRSEHAPMGAVAGEEVRVF